VLGRREGSEEVVLLAARVEDDVGGLKDERSGSKGKTSCSGSPLMSRKKRGKGRQQQGEEGRERIELELNIPSFSSLSLSATHLQGVPQGICLRRERIHEEDEAGI